MDCITQRFPFGIGCSRDDSRRCFRGQGLEERPCRKRSLRSGKKPRERKSSSLRAPSTLRQPLWAYNQRQFTDEEITHTTKNERWRLSEVEGYKKKIEIFTEELKRFDSAKLDLRVLVGSKIYKGFLPFDRSLRESIERVNAYLDLLQDHSNTYLPDSPEIIEVRRQLYPSDNLDDDLSQSLADSREEGEVLLLSHLHRKSIYG